MHSRATPTRTDEHCSGHSWSGTSLRRRSAILKLHRRHAQRSGQRCYTTDSDASCSSCFTPTWATGGRTQEWTRRARRSKQLRTHRNQRLSTSPRWPSRDGLREFCSPRCRATSFSVTPRHSRSEALRDLCPPPAADVCESVSCEHSAAQGSGAALCDALCVCVPHGFQRASSAVTIVS